MTNTELDTSKQCTKCHEQRPYSEFSPNRHHKDGLQSVCKGCARYLVRQWYERNSERKNVATRKYNKEHVVRIRETLRLRELKTPKQNKARQSVRNAVMSGELQRLPCHCGETKVDFHHTNGYEKENWFVGQWLCRKHHAQTHKELRWNKS